jgi:hypothetical protein
MGIERDISGLVDLHEKCFEQTTQEIPEYEGTEIKATSYNNGTIEDNLSGEAFEWHKKNDRQLSEILLACAYNLGRDSVLNNEVKERDKIIELLTESLNLLKES